MFTMSRKLLKTKIINRNRLKEEANLILLEIFIFNVESCSRILISRSALNKIMVKNYDYANKISN